MHQGVAIDSVDDIPNDEIYKDEQYRQRIAEQVQKLVKTKEILNDDSPKNNTLTDTCSKIHMIEVMGIH